MVKICANMCYQVSFFFFFCDKFEIDGTTRLERHCEFICSENLVTRFVFEFR